MKKCPKNCGSFDDYVIKCPNCGARLIRTKSNAYAGMGNSTAGNAQNNSGSYAANHSNTANYSNSRSNGSNNGNNNSSSNSCNNGSNRNSAGNSNAAAARQSFSSKGYNANGMTPQGNGASNFKYDRSTYRDPALNGGWNPQPFQGNTGNQGANTNPGNGWGNNSGNGWNNGSGNGRGNNLGNGWGNGAASGQMGGNRGNSPQPVAQSSDFSHAGVRGQVMNLYADSMPLSAFEKTWSVLVYGLNPFRLSDFATTFQLVEWDENGVETGLVYDVTMRGVVRAGRVNDGNVIRVWGKRANTGEVYAQKVRNETTNSWVKVVHNK